MRVSQILVIAALGIAACAGEVVPPDGGLDGGADGGADAGPDANTSWWKGKVLYSAFVRSFGDSNADGVGDLKGLIAHLDYLNDGNPDAGDDLGVDAIWLLPVYASPSYHGYDVTDYRAINPDYGTLADFDALIAAAHARGIRVILDYVPNHTSTQHPWFANAANGPSAQYRDWYVWSDTRPNWTCSNCGPLWYQSGKSFYYAYFWGGMPDLNYRNPAVALATADAMKFWLARGVDGFRLDAVRYLVEAQVDAGAISVVDQPETHTTLQGFKRAVVASNPEALLLGEVWASAGTVGSYLASGNELDLAFSFDEATALIGSLRRGASGDFYNAFDTTGRALGGNRDLEAPFLTNHDMLRVMRQLDGSGPAAKVAAATLFALPGTPTVYYGEEIGMVGGFGSEDEVKRTPMRWNPDASGNFGFSEGKPWRVVPEAQGVDVESQRSDPHSLWQRYRKSIALRHREAALSNGSASWIDSPTRPASVFAMLRTLGPKRVLFVANFGDGGTGAFALPLGGKLTVLDAEGLDGGVSATAESTNIATMPPYGFFYAALE